MRVDIAREKDSGLLECFADRGGAQRAHRAGPAVTTVREISQSGVVVALVDLAAGKDERAGNEVDLVMALDHEDFKSVRPIADQNDRGGGYRRDGWLLVDVCHGQSL